MFSLKFDMSLLLIVHFFTIISVQNLSQKRNYEPTVKVIFGERIFSSSRYNDHLWDKLYCLSNQNLHDGIVRIKKTYVFSSKATL